MENKADIDFTTETKKKKVLLFWWCVVYHFSSTKSIFSRKQTDRKLKNHPRIKICVRRAEKLGLLEQQTSHLIAMEFLFLRPAIFSLNSNVALHASSLEPPWSS